MILSQSSSRIAKLKADGIRRRAELLALVPEEFTQAQLVEASGLTVDAASGQIQKMVRWKEIEPTSAYKNPRVFRKIS